jgi:hypothetical protein
VIGPGWVLSQFWLGVGLEQAGRKIFELASAELLASRKA